MKTCKNKKRREEINISERAMKRSKCMNEERRKESKGPNEPILEEQGPNTRKFPIYSKYGWLEVSRIFS